MTMRHFARHLRAAALAGLALSAPLLAGATALDSNRDVRLLATHNRERDRLDIPPLAWDPALAADAAVYAQQLKRRGYLVHSPVDPTDPDPQGENLWAGTRGHYTPEAMVGLWVAEKADFKPGIFPDNSRSGNLEAVGHYTQLTWRSTRQVGCAVSRGAADDFLVCRYSEGGNILGERPF